MQSTREIGDKIRKAREDAAMTQEDLGKALGMSAMGISYIEKGLRKLKIEDLVKIAQKLKVSEAYLLEPVTGTVSKDLSSGSMHNFRSDFQLDPSEEKDARNKIDEAFNNLFAE